MTTPNPRGVTRCVFWDRIQNTVRTAETHWSYIPANRERKPRKSGPTLLEQAMALLTKGVE